MSPRSESALARRVVTEAISWVGTPYRHQASCKGVGTDCLGLVLGIWRALYGRQPEQQPGPYAPDWAEAGGNDRLMDAAERYCRAVPLDRATPGHLLIFRWRAHLPAKHAGILIAQDRFVHAYQGHSVTASALVPQWRRRIAGVFAFPPLRIE